MQTRKPVPKFAPKFINPHRLFHGVWLPQCLRAAQKYPKRPRNYAHLTYFAGGKGCAWPTFNTLAGKLHVSRRHLIGLVKELTCHGLISVMNVCRPGKGSCANHYRFLRHPWMQEESHGVHPDHGETFALEESESPDCSMGAHVIPPNGKNVTPCGDINVTPPGDMSVTPGVTPMSPKEIKKKRLIKKSPKGASGNSVPLQAAAHVPNSHHLAVGNVQPPSVTPEAHAAPEPGESTHPKDSPGDGGKSKSSAALARKGWAIARRLLAAFWKNCKVKPNLGIPSGYAIRSLQSGFREIDLISAFERALHQCHGHATDVGEIWEASSTVHRAEALLRESRKRWRPLTADERAELRARIKLSLLGTPVEKEPRESTASLRISSRNSSRKKENEPIPPEQWPSPMEVRATFNAFRRAADLPTRPESNE